MLIFLLFTTIMRLIGGEETFTIPKLEKEIKTHISDDNRKDTLLIILKDAEKETKKFYKAEGKSYDKIKKLMSDDDNQSENVSLIFKENMQNRIKLQDFHIAKRLEMQKLIKPEEWDYILKNAISPSDKMKKETAKKDLKIKEFIKKVMDKTEKTIKKEIDDKEKQEKLISSLSNLRESLNVHVEEGLRVNYEKNEVLKLQSSTKEELRTVYNNQNKIRENIAIEFYNFYNVVHKQSDLKERKAIRKEVAKIF